MNHLILTYLCIVKWIARGSQFKIISNDHVSKMNIYREMQLYSIIQCSYVCKADSIAGCTRFMWSYGTKTCMLHSEEKAVSSLVMPSDAIWFAKLPSGSVCNRNNYDLDVITNSCIRLGYDQLGKTWTQARASCQEDGGDLLSITTASKKDFVCDYLNYFQNKLIWIGLHMDSWVTGEDVTSEIFDRIVLNNYDPKYNDTDMSCGTINTVNGSAFCNDFSCNIRTSPYFLCELLV